MLSAQDIADLEAAPGDQASRLFLKQMTEHHTGAIDMAEQEVQDGEYAEAVAVAETIIQNQQTEIAQMETLLTGM